MFKEARKEATRRDPVGARAIAAMPKALHVWGLSLAAVFGALAPILVFSRDWQRLLWVVSAATLIAALAWSRQTNKE